MAHTALKYLLTFEDISYYLQYNARNEFFQTSIFKPNIECMDKLCIKNQQRVSEQGIDTIKAREEFIKARKAERNKNFKPFDDEEMKKWDISIVDDSEARHETVVIDSKERDELTMEQLMAQMKQL